MRLLVFILLGALWLQSASADGRAQEDKARTRLQERAARQAERSERRWWLGRRVADSVADKQTTAVPLAPERATSSADEQGAAATSGDPATKNLRQGMAWMHLEYAAHNFGDVPRKGGDLVYDFPFVNEGTVPLVVTRVITSCSCLKASYPKRPVAPGAKGVIRITYEPHKSEAGVFNKVIQVYSNTSQGRELITVQGNSIAEKE